MLTEAVTAARRVSVPLVAVTTQDQFCTERTLSTELTKTRQVPLFTWDLADGLRPLNKVAASAMGALLGDLDPQATQNPALALKTLERASNDTVVFMKNAHRVLDHPEVIQAVANLRDRFKHNGRMLILLGPVFRLPAELQHDIIVLDDPLPDLDLLRSIVTEQIQAAGLPLPSQEDLEAASRTLRGLSAFAAEQAVALSLTKEGLHMKTLWDRKVQMVNDCRGLSIWTGPETFKGLGGLEQIKSLLGLILKGRKAPQAIVFIDEIEKAMAGAAGPLGDSSGVSQDFLGCLLSYMQDRQVAGIIFVGPPGTAKSAVAKAAGNDGGIPTIKLDLGAAKGSLVGESEATIRQALKTIDAVSDGNSLWIATCNKVAVLPPELRRRFRFGTIFFDLPTEQERATIWSLYRRKFEIPAEDVKPVDDGWTGAEIETCCQLAWQLSIPLEAAGRYIVPVSKAAPEVIGDLRRQAAGRFLSASFPGVYQLPEHTVAPPDRRSYRDVN